MWGVGLNKITTLKFSNTRSKPKYPCNTSPPIQTTSRPIKSVLELQHWESGHDPLNVCHIPLQPRHKSSVINSEGLNSTTSKMKVIHCHDMAGGYLDDSHSLGGSNFDVYNFYNWQFIDTFIYFSHSRVTIPREYSNFFIFSVFFFNKYIYKTVVTI